MTVFFFQDWFIKFSSVAESESAKRNISNKTLRPLDNVTTTEGNLNSTLSGNARVKLNLTKQLQSVETNFKAYFLRKEL